MSLKQCPECGGTISDKATICPHCGAPLKTQNVTDPKDENQSDKCSETKYNQDALQYPKTPTNSHSDTIDDNTSLVQEEQMNRTSKNNKKKGIIGLIIAVIVIIVIIGCIQSEKNTTYYNNAVSYYNAVASCGNHIDTLANKYVDHWYDPGDSINNYIKGDGAELYNKMETSYEKSQKIYAKLADHPKKYDKLYSEIQTTNKNLNACYSQVTTFPKMTEDTFEERISEKFNSLSSALKDMNATLNENN